MIRRRVGSRCGAAKLPHRWRSVPRRAGEKPPRRDPRGFTERGASFGKATSNGRRDWTRRRKALWPSERGRIGVRLSGASPAEGGLRGRFVPCPASHGLHGSSGRRRERAVFRTTRRGVTESVSGSFQTVHARANRPAGTTALHRGGRAFEHESGRRRAGTTTIARDVGTNRVTTRGREAPRKRGADRHPRRGPCAEPRTSVRDTRCRKDVGGKAGESSRLESRRSPWVLG